MKQFSLLAVLSAALPYVAAHGFVSSIAIDGKEYAGNVPNNYKGPSPIRLVSDISPVKGATNPDVFCGLKSQPAEMVVPANPGSKLAIQWSGGAGQKWPHNTGPLITYMSSTGSTTADKFDTAADASFFKIDEAGKKPNDDSTWVQQDIMNGDSYTLNLPNDLKPGDYLVRHEIVALHLAVTEGGAEFYPSCFQLRIGGNGNGTPNETVTFPGAYKDTDPGIFDPSVFDSGAPYTFPGPPMSNLAATAEEVTPPVSETASFPPASATATGSAKGSGASSTRSSAPAASATGGAKSSSNAQCKLKKRQAGSTDAASASNINRPRHFNRMMRRILHSS